MRTLVLGLAVVVGSLALTDRAEAAKGTLLDKKLRVSDEFGGAYAAARAEMETEVEKAKASGRLVLHTPVIDEGGGAGSPLWWVLEWIGGGIAGVIVGIVLFIPIGVLIVAMPALALIWTLVGQLAILAIVPPVVVWVVTWMAATFDGVNGDFMTALIYTYLAFAVSVGISIVVALLGLPTIISQIVGFLAGLMPVYAVNFMTAGGGSGVPEDTRRDVLLPEDRHGLAPNAALAPAPIRPALAFSF